MAKGNLPNSSDLLISFPEVIERAKNLGASFGKGDPYNRLRYYTKIGLLPKATRKSFASSAPAGAYRESVVEKIVEIDRHLKSGESIQAILRENKDDLLPIEKIISRAKNAGVDFGKGDPSNRLRYYTKIGLLPNATRKSFSLSAPTGAYRESVVETLVGIDQELKSGKTIQALLRERQVEEKNEDKENSETETRQAAQQNHQSTSFPITLLPTFTTIPARPQLNFPEVSLSPSLEEIKAQKPSFLAGGFAKSLKLSRNFALPVFLILIFLPLTLLIGSFAKGLFFSRPAFESLDLSKTINGGVVLASSIDPYFNVNVETDFNSLVHAKEGVAFPSGSFSALLETATLTSDRNISLPDQSGTLCLNSGNCAGQGKNGDITAIGDILAGAAFTDGGAGNELYFHNGSQGLLTATALSSERTYTLPNLSGTVALQAVSSFTPGSVIFAGSGGLLTQDNSNFFFNNTNNYLGLGTNSPTSTLDVRSSLSSGGLINVEASSATTLTGDLNGLTVDVSGYTGGSPSGTPVLNAILVSNVTPNNAINEAGLRIGTGWENAIEINVDPADANAVTEVTAIQSPVIHVGGNYVKNIAAASLAALTFDPTIIVNTSPDILAGADLFQIISPTYLINQPGVNILTNNINLSNVANVEVASSATGAHTLSALVNYSSFFDLLVDDPGTASLTVSNVNQFSTSSSFLGSGVTTGVTVTNLNGFLINNQVPTGGTLTNQYGIHALNLTGGTNDYAFYSEGADSANIYARAATSNTSTTDVIRLENRAATFTGDYIDISGASSTDGVFDHVLYSINGTPTSTVTSEAASLGGTPFTVGASANDSLNFGESTPFSRVYIDFATLAGAPTSVSWEYCSANASTATACDTWSSLTGVSDGTSNLTSDGTVTWAVPGGWIQSAETGVTPRYYARVFVNSITAGPATAYSATIAATTSGNYLRVAYGGTNIFTLNNFGALNLATPYINTTPLTISAPSNNTSTINGISISGITGGSGSETGISVGTGWDYGIHSQSLVRFDANIELTGSLAAPDLNTEVLCRNNTTTNLIASCSASGGVVGNAFVHLAPEDPDNPGSALADIDNTTRNSIYINKTGASGDLIHLCTGASCATEEFRVDFDGNTTLGGSLLVATTLQTNSSAVIGDELTVSGDINFTTSASIGDGGDALSINSSGTLTISDANLLFSDASDKTIEVCNSVLGIGCNLKINNPSGSTNLNIVSGNLVFGDTSSGQYLYIGTAPTGIRSLVFPDVSGYAVVDTGAGSTKTLASANADGFSLSGGTTSRTLTVSGADVSLNQDLLTTSSPTFVGLLLNPTGGGAGNTGELRFLELAANGSGYAGFKAPDAITTDRIYTLPDDDSLPPSADYVLTWQTGNTLTWKEITGVGAAGDIIAVGDIASGAAFTATAGGDGNSLFFEGATADSFEIELTAADPGADKTVIIPVSSAASDSICLLTLGNCAGSGGIIGGSGTDGRIAKFTPDGSHIGDSILNETGGNIDLTSGNLLLSAITRITSAGVSTFTTGTYNGVNTAGNGADVLTLSGSLAAFDGSDTFRGLYLNYTNADHTGSSNTFNGIDIAGITADAQATENAINIGAGWDNAINFVGASNLALANSTSNALTIKNGSNTYFSISTLEDLGGNVHTISLEVPTGAAATSKIDLGAGTSNKQINIGYNNDSPGISLINIGNTNASSTISLFSGVQTATAITASVDALTSGTGFVTSAGALTEGKAVQITAENTLSSGRLLDIQLNPNFLNWSGATISGNLVNVEEAVFSDTGTSTRSGNLLSLSRTTINDGTALNITGAVASFTSSWTGFGSAVTDSANILSLNQAYPSATGAVLSIANSGSGADIRLNKAASVFTINTAGANSVTSLTLNNAASTNLLQIRDLTGNSTQFGSLVLADAFVSKQSYFAEEFNSFRGGNCADSSFTATSHQQARGEYGNPATSCTAQTGEITTNSIAGTSNASNTCTYSSNNATNGFERIASSYNTGTGVACLESIGTNANNTNNNIFNTGNFPQVVMKVRTNVSATTTRYYAGISNIATAKNAPVVGDKGVYFSTCSAPTTPTCNTTGWYGVVQDGTNAANVVTCPTTGFGTTNFSYLRIEFRKATSTTSPEIQFFVDNDVTNGIVETSCGTVTSTTSAMGNTAMSMFLMSVTTAAGTANLDVDYFRVWQDDSITQPENSDLLTTVAEGETQNQETGSSNPTDVSTLALDDSALAKLSLDEEKNLVASLSAQSQFKVKNAFGEVVASISDLGEAIFSSVQATFVRVQELVIGERLTIKKTAQIAGTASFEAGQEEVTIQTPKVKSESLIYLTPKTKTAGLSLYIKEVKEGESFTVGLDSSLESNAPVTAPKAVEFNWLLVDQEE